MSDLILGGFVFQDFEIPEVLPIGGAQVLAIKRLVGGARVIDAMGPDPRPIEWSGTFLPMPDGTQPIDSALEINRMKDAGLPVLLTYEAVRATVLIRTFEMDIRFGKVPYRISLEVLRDETAPLGVPYEPNADDLMAADFALASAFAAEINDPALTVMIGNLTLSIDGLPTFVGASASEVIAVLQIINLMQFYVQSQINSADMTLNLGLNF